MKDFKSIIIFTKNKYKVLTNRELKLSLNKSAIKSSKFYKSTKTKTLHKAAFVFIYRELYGLVVPHILLKITNDRFDTL